VADTWIEALNPSSPHGSDADLPIRVSGGVQRLLVKFDTSGLAGKTVTDATLHFYVSASDPGVSVFVYRLTSGFDEALATWSHASAVAWATPGGDYNPAPMTSFQAAGNCQFQLEVKALVQAWAADPASNQGLILVAVGPNGALATISSRENLNKRGPILSVTTNP
jgi:hypothetical protein